LSAPITLTPADRATECWHKLQKHYEARLATLRAQNDAVRSEAETNKIRGQIAEVKEFLKHGQDKPVFEDPIPRIDALPKDAVARQ
jgi:hypothetical protein